MVQQKPSAPVSDTPLTAVLQRQIRDAGPMSVAEYMALCLQHPEHGYYVTRDPLGRDFITAPEISQMFGELIGLCLAQAWLDQGAPSRFTLAELGPGRGTLMADALRAAARVPGFVAAADLVLMETSPVLRAEQAARLGDYAPRWLSDIADLPDAPLFLIANEFFDALPIRQFQRDEGPLWRERRIGWQDGALTFGLAGAVAQPQLSHRLDDTQPGDIVETNSAGLAILQEVARRIQTHRGLALVIDYGDWRTLGDTFQAMRHGDPLDPLALPGQADLTAHVDFEALAQIISDTGADHTKVTPQGVFLERLGITARAQVLARSLKGQAQEAHIAAHRRLTSPLEMGNLFKVLGVMPKGALPPPGLDR